MKENYLNLRAIRRSAERRLAPLWGRAGGGGRAKGRGWRDANPSIRAGGATPAGDLAAVRPLALVQLRFVRNCRCVFGGAKSSGHAAGSSGSSQRRLLTNFDPLIPKYSLQSRCSMRRLFSTPIWSIFSPCNALAYCGRLASAHAAGAGPLARRDGDSWRNAMELRENRTSLNGCSPTFGSTTRTPLQEDQFAEMAVRSHAGRRAHLHVFARRHCRPVMTALAPCAGKAVDR